MRIIQLIVFACLSIGTQPKYHFRFHTCYKEDQELLNKENLRSLHQVVFVDDGALVYHDVLELEDTAGITVTGPNAWNNHIPGAESALRIVNFRDFDTFIVINFWTRTYYFRSKQDSYSVKSPDKTVKPSLDHFVRVYFVCAPGNSRSALILFGEQATRRRKPRSAPEVEDELDDEETSELTHPGNSEDDDDLYDDEQSEEEDELELEESDHPDISVKSDGEEAVETKHIVKRNASTAKKKIRQFRLDRYNARMKYRSKLHKRKVFTSVHLGFGLVVMLNAIILTIYFWKARTPLPLEVAKKEPPKKDANGTTTTTTTLTIKKNSPIE